MFLPTVRDEEGCELGAAEEVGEQPGSDRAEAVEDGRFEVEVEGLAGLIVRPWL